MKNIYKHETALVETKEIGKDTRIWAFTHIMKGARIGDRCNVGEQCFIETGVTVGSDVTIKNGNHLWEGVTLADGVFVGPGVCFTNDLHPRSPRLPQAAKRYRNRRWLSPTHVRTGASLGAGAIILAGKTIGEFAMVGSGAVVADNVPAYALVVGTPARVIGWVCQCGCRLWFQDVYAQCDECGLQFLRDRGAVHVKDAPPVAD